MRPRHWQTDALTTRLDLLRNFEDAQTTLVGQSVRKEFLSLFLAPLSPSRDRNDPPPPSPGCNQGHWPTEQKAADGRDSHTNSYNTVKYLQSRKLLRNKSILSHQASWYSAVLGTRDILADPYLWLMDPDPDPTPDPTTFFNDFKDLIKKFHIFFLITYPQVHH